MKFEIYEERSGMTRLAELSSGTKGTWRWRLRASNGEPIAQGEDYVNKADCRRAVDLLKSTTMATEVIELV